MRSEEDHLAAVNWEHGMLLTPDHLVRQERYLESALLWLARYVSSVHGLVGEGTRPLNGASSYDPVVELLEAGGLLKISVSRCRGLTPAGTIVDVDPTRPVRCDYPLSQLEGVVDSTLHVLAEPFQKEVVSEIQDPANPDIASTRRQTYRLVLGIHADQAPYSLAIAKLQRSPSGGRYQLDDSYIPPCASMLSHSNLGRARQEILEQIKRLAESYRELRQSMLRLSRLMRERDLDLEIDQDSALFLERMEIALEDSVYELFDPTHTPSHFFSSLRRLFRKSALFFGMSPGLRAYMDELRDVGESQFLQSVKRQEDVLSDSPTSRLNENLALEIKSATLCLSDLKTLERALEGKYLDFRISPSLEALNFFFDPENDALYRLVKHAAGVQGEGHDRYFYFSGLSLEGKYRLVLTSEATATFEKGYQMAIDVRINEGTGFRRAAQHLTSEVVVPGQRNFPFDVDLGEAATVTDLRVVVPLDLPIRRAMLYHRHRFSRQREPLGGAGRLGATAPRAQAAEPGKETSQIPVTPDRERPRAHRLEPARDQAKGTEEHSPAPGQRAPWEEEHELLGKGAPEPPPRRKRLE